MQSRIAASIGLSNNPVALVWADVVPVGTPQFKPGRWGCVMSMFAAVAAKGKTAAFDRTTYGCWGGGIGLGFGNCYEVFPGGIEGFCGFLADGNEKTDWGRQIGQGLAQAGVKQLADDFLLGERYLKTVETTQSFLSALPIRDIPAKYVVLKPLSAVNLEQDDVKNVTFVVEPDLLSALVVLANHTHPEVENVGIPYAAACQVIGLLAYREAEQKSPRALVGLTDISARKNTRALLGRNAMTFTIPWPLFLEMEENVEDSFLQRGTWRSLQSE
jgi:hypothetical protein